MWHAELVKFILATPSLGKASSRDQPYAEALLQRSLNASQMVMNKASLLIHEQNTAF